MRHSISLSVFQSQQIAFLWLLVPVDFFGFIHNEEWMVPAGSEHGQNRISSTGQRKVAALLSSWDALSRNSCRHQRHGDCHLRNESTGLWEGLIYFSKRDSSLDVCGRGSSCIPARPPCYPVFPAGLQCGLDELIPIMHLSQLLTDSVQQDKQALTSSLLWATASWGWWFLL